MKIICLIKKGSEQYHVHCLTYKLLIFDRKSFSTKLGWVVVHGILNFYNFTFCNRNALRTTETELNAMAAPASQGARKPRAAIGIPSEL